VNGPYFPQEGCHGDQDQERKNELVDELLKDADPKKVLSSEYLRTDVKKALA
jgi:hypothetical protein